MALKRRGVPIDGVAIRDRSEDVARFLAEWGDPFERIGADPASRVQFALGSSGVPETFVVDGKGVIRHQHIGDIRPENVRGDPRGLRGGEMRRRLPLVRAGLLALAGPAPPPLSPSPRCRRRATPTPSSRIRGRRRRPRR